MLIAKVYHLQDSIIILSARLTESPYLAWSITSVATEHWKECAPLEHTHIVFPVVLILNTFRELTLIEPSASVASCEERTESSMGFLLPYS